MDTLLVAAAFVIPLTVALAWAIWYLVALGRKERRRRTPTRHVFRGQGEAVTVAELLAEAAEQGAGRQLNWTAADETQVRWWPNIRPYAQDQIGTVVKGNASGSGGEFPTEILPTIADEL